MKALISAAVICLLATAVHADDYSDRTEPYGRYQQTPPDYKCTGDIQPTICQLPITGGGSEGGSDGGTGGDSGQ